MNLLKTKLSTEHDTIRIYPIGDLHIGSQDFNEKLWKKTKEIIKKDDNGYVILLGDLIDNALKNSKSDVYAQTMSPREQKKWLLKELKDIGKEKILMVLRGNHETRTMRETSDDIIEDICIMMDIEEKYQTDLGILKVSYGQRNKLRQYVNCISAHHGCTKSKREKFSYVIDNCDCFITGHTHCPEISEKQKLSIDLKNDTISIKTIKTLVVPSFLNYGGYGVEKMYLPNQSSTLYYLELDKGNINILTKTI